MDKSRNWLLIAGISLPVVLLLLFVGFAKIARQYVEPAQYELYFSSYYYTSNNSHPRVQLTYSVVDERVQVHGRPNQYATSNRLYRLDPASGDISEVIFEVPKITAEAGETFVIAKLARVKVSGDFEAPDGYRLTDNYQRGPGLIGELFSSRRNTGLTLEKSGAAFHFDPPDTTNYGSVQFVGWILNDKVSIDE